MAKELTEEQKEKNRERARIWYYNNKEKVLAQRKEYYEENKEEILEQRNEYYELNKEKIRIYKQDYWDENKDEINSVRRKDRTENRVEYAIKRKVYDSTLKGMCVRKSSHYREIDRKRFGIDEGSVTSEQMQEMIEVQPYCFYCGCKDIRQLGLDRMDNSKPHTVDNCVVACWNCNNERQKMPFIDFCKKKGIEN